MIGIPHPYLTGHLDGIGGHLKQKLEDFIVEEVPLYHPLDRGEHTFVFIEKSDFSTLEAMERISHELSIPLREFGFAGLKDRKGITRQVLSIRGASPEKLLRLQLPQIRILWARLHTNKLRVGHLRGNRFRIRIRDVEPDLKKLTRIIQEIQQLGLPNFFGPQRFGNRGDAYQIGRALLKRDYEQAIRRFLGYPMATERNPHVVEARRCFMAGDLKGAYEKYPRSYRQERQILEYLMRANGTYRGAIRLFSGPVRRLYFSAFQAYLFNRALERRLAESENSPGRLYTGDLAWIHRSGAVFRVTEVNREQPRAESFEISPSGPIFGTKMVQPEGLQGRIENDLLLEEEILPNAFKQLVPGLHMEGARRPMRVPVRELRYELQDKDLLLEFFLPKGSYATTFLREFMKNEELPPVYLDTGCALSGSQSTALRGAEKEAEPADLEADDEPPVGDISEC